MNSIKAIPQVIARRAIACLPSHPLDRWLIAAAVVAAPAVIAFPRWEARAVAAPIAPIALAVADHRRDRRRLAGYKARVLALESEQRSHIDEILCMARNAEQERDRLESELSGALAESAELQAAVAAAKAQIATLETEQIQWQEWEQGAIEDRHQLQMAQERLERDRQIARLELQSQIDRAHGDLASAQSDLDRAKAEIQFLAGNLRDCQSEIAKLRAEIESYAGIEDEMARQRDRHETALARRDQRIAELVAAKDHAARALAVEQSLEDLAAIITAAPRPILICGPQGSGKATTAINAIAPMAGDIGAIALALDPSEGGDRSGAWARAGIPATDDPSQMLEFMTAMVGAIERGDRLHRNDPDFKNQPPIIPIFDELSTITQGLSTKESEQLIEAMGYARTRGAKYGIYPIFLSQSEQIQNLKSGKFQILNSGNLSSFLRIWLCGVLDDFVAKNPSMIDEKMEQYLEANAGRYTAAAVISEGGARVLKPIRHPSHHGQIQGDGSPSRPIPRPKIITPDWLPEGLQGAFLPMGDGDTPNPSPFAPEPLPALAKSARTDEAKAGEFDPFGPMERAERSAIIRLLERSMGRAAIARALYGISKGASPRYAAARAKIDEIAAELSKGILAK